MSDHYRVVLGPLARNDLEEAYQYAASRDPVAAARWYYRFVDALKTLSERPGRCPFSPESGRSPVELRDFLFGKRPYVFRVIYTIRRRINHTHPTSAATTARYRRNPRCPRSGLMARLLAARLAWSEATFGHQHRSILLGKGTPLCFPRWWPVLVE